jgi:drug/metabolite transporter (DMT)-like permease
VAEQQPVVPTPEDRRLTGTDGLLLLTVLFWGANFSVVKYALTALSPFAVNALRFTLATVALNVALLLSGPHPKLTFRRKAQLVGLGLLGYVAYQVLFIQGIHRTTAGNSAIILATVPVWVAVIGSLAGMEKVRALGWIGIALSLGGIAVLTQARASVEFSFGGATLLGDVLVLLSTLCWAGYTLLLRPMLKTCSAVQVTAVACLGALPVLLLLAAPSLLALDWSAVPTGVWFSLSFSGLFSISLGYVFWNYGVSRLGSTRASLYTNVTPAFALFIAWIWLDETLAVGQAFGVVLVLGGVMLARSFVAAK